MPSFRRPKIPTRFAAVKGFAEALREARAAVAATVGGRRGWRIRDYYSALVVPPSALNTKGGGCWRDHLFAVERELRCRRQIPHLAVAVAAVIVLLSMPVRCHRAASSSLSSSHPSWLQWQERYRHQDVTGHGVTRCDSPALGVIRFVSHLVIKYWSGTDSVPTSDGVVGDFFPAAVWGALFSTHSVPGLSGGTPAANHVAASLWPLTWGQSVSTTADVDHSLLISAQLCARVVFYAAAVLFLVLTLRRFVGALARQGYADGLRPALRIYTICVLCAIAASLFWGRADGDTSTSYPALAAVGWLLAVKAFAYAVA
jgi:hypothetical protein